MRTAHRQSSFNYLIKTEKPMQIQNEDGQSGKLFWICETLLLLFSWKQTSEPVQPLWRVPCPSRTETINFFLEPDEPWPQGCVCGATNSPTAAVHSGRDTEARHCPRREQSAGGAGEWKQNCRPQSSSRNWAAQERLLVKPAPESKRIRWTWLCSHASSSYTLILLGSSGLQRAPGC